MNYVGIVTALVWVDFVPFLQPATAQLSLGQSPPYYNGSFRALGEILWSRPNEGPAVKGVQFFEELYDSANLRAALRIHTADETLVYVQDIETKQTFLHRSSGPNETCDLIRKKPDGHVFGPLRSQDGLQHFYLRDLLTSQLWNTSPDQAHYPERNMSCDVWTIETEDNGKPLIIAMAVNSISWDSTTDTMQTPVSVNIRYANGEGDMIQVNIYSFTALDTIHDELLQLPDGVFCVGYKRAIPRPPIADMKVFNYRAEMLSPHGFTFYSDVWVDLERNLYRIDYSPTNSAKTFERTLIVSGNEDAFYRISSQRKNICKVKGLLDLKFDIQMISDPVYIKHMTPETFFGGDDHDINWTYKKRTVKRGIPCDVWESLRADWPPDSDGIETLWEWCFVHFEGQESNGTKGSTHMVSLDLTVQRVSTGVENPLGLEEGEVYSYSFYDSFRHPPEQIDLHGFDISPCYGDSDSTKAFIQVKLSASDYAKLSAAPTLYDPKFLSAWRTAIGQATSLSDHSLRVTNINAYFAGNNVLFVTFVLLDRFPAGVTVGIEDTQANLADMIKNLDDAVREGRLGITYNEVNLTAYDWSPGPPLTPKPKPTPPVTTSAPITISTSTPEIVTTTPEVTTRTEDVTTAAPASTTPVTVSTTPFEIITEPVVTDDHSEGAETTVPTVDVITELPAALGGVLTRYAPGVVGGTTVGLFVLGSLIGASGTYAIARFFPSTSWPTTVFH